jgi:hypothetical protein
LNLKGVQFLLFLVEEIWLSINLTPFSSRIQSQVLNLFFFDLSYRAWGFGVVNVLAAEVVLADGSIIQVSLLHIEANPFTNHKLNSWQWRH